MIEKNAVIDVLKTLPDDYFIVDLNISKTNKIELIIDRISGINIDDCVAISRLVENNLDREKEDFELNVFSPGLGSPFKTAKQYIKNIGQQIEVVPMEQKPLKGTLVNYNNDTQQITLEVEEKVKLPDSKKKSLIKKEYIFDINEIKTAKNIISFK